MTPDERILVKIRSAEQFVNDAFYTYNDDATPVYGEGVRDYAMAYLGRAMLTAVAGSESFIYVSEAYARNPLFVERCFDLVNAFFRD